MIGAGASVGVSTLSAFLLTAFSLAELGDGFGAFFDIYLLGLGWTETAVILSGILRGVVDLSLKGVVGDIIDKTTSFDRRIYLGVASLAIAASSCMVFAVNGSEGIDKAIVFCVRAMESVALAFLGPAFAAITLSAFGPELFDKMQVQKELVSHAGSILSAVLSGLLAWYMYPNIEVVFLLPTLFAISTIFFVRQIPRGDPLMGRGFHGTTEKRDEEGCVVDTHKDEPPPKAATYWDVFSDRRIVWIIVADVFHVLAEANVGLVFNELLAGVGSYTNNDDGDNNNNNNNRDDDAGDDDSGLSAVMSRSAIPLMATAGCLAQIVMIAGTWLVGYLTDRGWGRKPFYVLHLSIHPIRVALILLCIWTDAGSAWMASTELVGGLTGAFGVVNAFMQADILFGSGRFNVVDGFRATIRGVAATSSAYVGACILQNHGPSVALVISFFIAIIPPVIGYIFVPETLGMRQIDFVQEKTEEKIHRAMSKEQGESSGFGYILMSFSGDHAANTIRTTKETELRQRKMPTEDEDTVTPQQMLAVHGEDKTIV